MDELTNKDLRLLMNVLDVEMQASLDSLEDSIKESTQLKLKYDYDINATHMKSLIGHIQSMREVENKLYRQLMEEEVNTRAREQ